MSSVAHIFSKSHANRVHAIDFFTSKQNAQIEEKAEKYNQQLAEYNEILQVVRRINGEWENRSGRREVDAETAANLERGKITLAQSVQRQLEKRQSTIHELKLTREGLLQQLIDARNAVLRAARTVDSAYKQAVIGSMELAAKSYIDAAEQIIQANLSLKVMNKELALPPIELGFFAGLKIPGSVGMKTLHAATNNSGQPIIYSEWDCPDLEEKEQSHFDKESQKLKGYVDSQFIKRLEDEAAMGL